MGNIVLSVHIIGVPLFMKAPMFSLAQISSKSFAGFSDVCNQTSRGQRVGS